MPQPYNSPGFSGPVFSRRAFLKTSALAGLGCSFIPRVNASDPTLKPPQFLKEWGKKGTGPGEFNSPIGIAINQADEIFITEARNNRVQKFTADGKWLATFPVAAFPGGIAVDRAGHVYIAPLMLGKICVYDAKGKLIREWGKIGKGDGELDQPGGIVLGPDSNVYVADQINRRVQKFSRLGKFLGKWGEYGTKPGQFGGNIPRPQRVGGPHFLAFDGKGHIYTTEASVGRIQKFATDGKFLLAWGNNGTEPGGFGGRPKNLPGPIALCFDKQERVWVSATNNRVQQFTADGKFLRGFGGAGNQPGQFHIPHGLAINSRGHLFVVDAQNHRLQKFAV
jgi:tripartite motif-containing protein 71